MGRHHQRQVKRRINGVEKPFQPKPISVEEVKVGTELVTVDSRDDNPALTGELMYDINKHTGAFESFKEETEQRVKGARPSIGLWILSLLLLQLVVAGLWAGNKVYGPITFHVFGGIVILTVLLWLLGGIRRRA